MAPPSPATRAETVGRARLLDLAGDDPWVRWGLGDQLPGEALVHEGVALVQRLGHRPGLWVAPLRPGRSDGRSSPWPTRRYTRRMR